MASIFLVLHLHAREESLAAWLSRQADTRISKGVAVTLRIYADFNGLYKAADGKSLVIELDTFGTLRDLSNAGVRLEDGFALTVSDWSDGEEDLEADVTARYNADRDCWMGVLDSSGYRYVPKRDRTPDHRFLCLGCRRDLQHGLAAHPADASGLRSEACPTCGTPTTAALAAPRSTRLDPLDAT